MKTVTEYLKESVSSSINENFIKNIARKILAKADKSAMASLKKALGEASAAEVAVMINQTKNPKDIISSMERYLRDNTDKDIQKVYDMVSK